MFLLILFSLAIIFVFHQLYWRRRNLPPGPMPWPILGNIPILDEKDLDGQLLNMKKLYGPVFTLWLPGPTVIVSDHELMKSTFIHEGDKFAGRPDLVTLKDLVQGNYGLAFSNDIFWRSQRRFGLHVLRDFGFGRPILEETVINQAADVCEYFKSFKGEPMDPLKTLVTSVGNIIYQLTFGKTTSLDDDLILNFRNKTLEAFSTLNLPIVFLMELWEPLRGLDFFLGGGYKKALKINNENLDFLANEIDEHRVTIDFDAEPRDYIDSFLIEQQKQNPKLINDGEWSDKQLIGSLYDLFAAGMETTATTLQMLILHLLYEPEIQRKIHEEIDRIIEKDEIISMFHQSKLPYFNACLQELQRIVALLPMNLQHRMTERGIVNGYQLPKGTVIVPQFESVHKDEKVFPNPRKFDPTRFIDSEGNFKKDERVTPFSIGKRACLGESLARMELFLFGATYLQKFEFLPENPNKLPPFEYDISFVKTPKPFKVRIQERH